MTKACYITLPISILCIFFSMLSWLLCNDTACGWWGFFGLASMFLASQFAKEN